MDRGTDKPVKVGLGLAMVETISLFAVFALAVGGLPFVLWPATTWVLRHFR
jgi:hypothetical protein